jgi:uncharacterized BrkB/YihY/UPF0761 family membrane protein
MDHDQGAVLLLRHGVGCRFPATGFIGSQCRFGRYGKFFDGILPLPEFILSGINSAVSLAGVALLFALIFKYLPETKIAWKDIWLGAAVVGSAYGAAGSLVVVVVWVYYSAMYLAESPSG